MSDGGGGTVGIALPAGDTVTADPDRARTPICLVEVRVHPFFLFRLVLIRPTGS